MEGVCWIGGFGLVGWSGVGKGLWEMMWDVGGWGE